MSVFSQKGYISGIVTDNKDTSPIEYVSIVCKKNDSIITGGITNKEGEFSIKNLPLGKLTLEIQFIGYKTITKMVNLNEQQANQSLNISLQENSEKLDDVEIQSTTITQKIDRKVINVGKDLTSAGTNALEMLQNIPLVLVDTQTGNVNLRGGNARILIDGRPSNLSASQVLKQLPANSIKKIELITNPSARYSPEGMNGIINFILKKNKSNGFNGSVTTGLEHGQNTRPTSSLNLNYRAGKVNFFGNFSFDGGKYATTSGLFRNDKVLNQYMDFLYDNVGKTIKFGADYYINDKNILSFYSNQFYDDADFTVNTKVSDSNSLLINQNTQSKLTTKEQRYNLNYKLTLNDEGENLEIETTYTTSSIPEDNVFSEILNPTSKKYNYFNLIENDKDSWLLNLDYTKPFSETSKLEAGVDVRLFTVFNKILSDQRISNELVGNNKFNVRRNIYAAYANYNKEFGKITLQTGLRLEQFTIDGIFNNDINNTVTTSQYNDAIFNFYPSAYLGYIPNDNHEFYINYSRRVDRPSIDQITPIPDFSTPLTISTGNQELEPQYTNGFEFNYTRILKSGYISLGTIYRTTNNKIDRVVLTDARSPDLQILSFRNNDKSDRYGFELFATTKIKKWWNTNFSANFYVQDRRGIVDNESITVKNNLFYSILNNNFKITKKFSLQLNGMYIGESKTPQFTRKPYYKIDAGAKLSIINGKGSINVRGSDIFNTMSIDLTSTNPFAQQGYFNTEFQNIYVGFTYNFGSGKNKARKRKERDKQETEGSGGIL